MRIYSHIMRIYSYVTTLRTSSPPRRPIVIETVPLLGVAGSGPLRDRTTVGRNILPLQRRRLIVVKRGESDARRKELHLTATGLARLEAGFDGWAIAQAQFEGTLGKERASQLRDLLHVVVDTDFRAEPDVRV